MKKKLNRLVHHRCILLIIIASSLFDKMRQKRKKLQPPCGDVVTPLFAANGSPPPHVSFSEGGFRELFWKCLRHVEARGTVAASWLQLRPASFALSCDSSVPNESTASRPLRVRERCQRGVRPPGAGTSRPSGGWPSTTRRTCPRTTPPPRGGHCSAPRPEVTTWLGPRSKRRTRF